MNKHYKLEQWITSAVFYVVPIIVFVILIMAYKWIAWENQLQKIFAWRGMNLLIFLLFIKPLYVISEKYFKPEFWNISDFGKYVLKWWIQKPILIFIKELIVNIVYMISGFFLKYRRLLGILTFWCIFLHLTLLWIGRNKLWMNVFFNISETFIWIGYVWIASLFVGFITSNNLSMRILSRNWKIVQQIAYIALFAWSLHSAIREWERLNSIVLIIIYVILKIFERKNIGLVKAKSETVSDCSWRDFEERKCWPCGYIYSEQSWDPEWWIAPGTKREDIPNNRKCPICGVWKEQFTIIVRKNNKIEYIKWKIINRKMLTDNVLELSVEFKEDLKIKPGQWIGFIFNDEKWEFIRAYSIAYHEHENSLTDCIFAIKLLDEWRWSKKLKELKIGDEVKANWVFGHFVLNDNNSEKIFIATWTWLAPIINMIKNCSPEIKKTLIFGSQHKSDIFYEEDIKKISNLDYKIFLSREEVAGYEYGRIDLNKFELNDNMEFYVCGAPPVVKSMLDYLKLKWFKKVYYEQFF